MHTKFLKRTIAILTCLALLTGCFAFSVVSAAADGISSALKAIEKQRLL